ncbi:MAG: hypothetical protein COX20_13645 [Desulfobacterales bacterium CG23_combo_of_CG06-09_8_20_14_all_52_9]|nr:MAG: hypothetical protein COX20_13645 [Desulfobacterales bacterium CG23_combo_of_CG06-09_8_20_14_all_52_9]
MGHSPILSKVTGKRAFLRMDRRTFLKIAAMGSLSFASGCSSQPDKTLFSLVQAPDDMVTGRGTWFASTCRECPAGCGIVAKNREGRAIKLEGNPLHPINRGRLCMRGQAALQGVYNPDRLSKPLIRENGRLTPISYEKALSIIQDKGSDAAKKGQGRVAVFTEMVGPTLLSLFKALLAQWHSETPTLFEPFAYESLKLANSQVFGIDGLASYRMEQADLLVSFGADFLETWLSPVEYARRFQQMRAFGSGGKGVYLHVGPYAGLTAANADRFMVCRCGGEAFVAFGLIREVLEKISDSSVSGDLVEPLKRILDPFDREEVLKLSGIRQSHYDLLIERVLSARRPLILGTQGAGAGENTPATDVASCLLNALLDPDLTLIDFSNRHTVERTAKRSDVLNRFKSVTDGKVDLLLLNNIDPVFSVPYNAGFRKTLGQDSPFVVCFSSFMSETAALSDLIVPIAHPLESWDAYEGKTGVWSILQPVMGNLVGTYTLGDLLVRLAFKGETAQQGYRGYLANDLIRRGMIKDERDWIKTVQQGGAFDGLSSEGGLSSKVQPSWSWAGTLSSAIDPGASGTIFAAVPSIRLFDGRGANKPWLNEAPEPMTQVAWQTPVLMDSHTAAKNNIRQGDVLKIASTWGELEAPVYLSEFLHPDLLVMAVGQGHTAYGRYAKGFGTNAAGIFPPDTHPVCGGPLYRVAPISLTPTGKWLKPANTDGSRVQHHRKIALTVPLKALYEHQEKGHPGLGMWDFPLTLPLPEGYDPQRDFYPPHDHDGYRWAMVIDLDRCIGCGACAVACYAENNIGVVGEKRILQGREMAWLRIERYLDEADPTRVIFLPMLCQHCDNAPCESVCPVYASHHSREGLNNQIYNRCIGTRFCSQMCPYKVRRFNWFDWEWPAPLNFQLNPDVTVRSKGVTEKCSFCIQRIKAAHGKAKDEGRMIQDGEVIPACAQTCPTDAFVFGNLMDKTSRIRKLMADPRAYQVMGYLNTKPAVIYLKKVIRDV